MNGGNTGMEHSGDVDHSGGVELLVHSGVMEESFEQPFHSGSAASTFGQSQTAWTENVLFDQQPPKLGCNA